MDIYFERRVTDVIKQYCLVKYYLQILLGWAMAFYQVVYRMDDPTFNARHTKTNPFGVV